MTPTLVKLLQLSTAEVFEGYLTEQGTVKIFGRSSKLDMPVVWFQAADDTGSERLVSTFVGSLNEFNPLCTYYIMLLLYISVNTTTSY